MKNVAEFVKTKLKDLFIIQRLSLMGGNIPPDCVHEINSKFQTSCYIFFLIHEHTCRLDLPNLEYIKIVIVLSLQDLLGLPKIGTVHFVL